MEIVWKEVVWDFFGYLWLRFLIVIGFGELCIYQNEWFGIFGGLFLEIAEFRVGCGFYQGYSFLLGFLEINFGLGFFIWSLFIFRIFVLRSYAIFKFSLVWGQEQEEGVGFLDGRKGVVF